MILSALDVASTSRWSAIWEYVEYASEGIVFLGCVGEYVAEYTKWRTEEARHSIGRQSLMILILGLGFGLFSLIKTNALAGLIIASLGEQVEQAGEKAERVSASLEMALSKATQAETVSSDALSNSTKAQTSASDALTQARGARQEADTFEKRLGSAEQKADEAESHLAEAHKEALAAKRELDEYKAPRELTLQQQARIGSIIRQFAPFRIDVLVVGGTTEVQHITESVLNAIRSGGWTIGNFAVPLGGISATGITVLTHFGHPPEKNRLPTRWCQHYSHQELPPGATVPNSTMSFPPA